MMGKRRLLPNGNLMVTASLEARAYEVTTDARLVGQITYVTGGGKVAILTSVAVLPPDMDAAFFAKARARCGGQAPDRSAASNSDMSAGNSASNRMARPSSGCAKPRTAACSACLGNPLTRTKAASGNAPAFNARRPP